MRDILTEFAGRDKYGDACSLRFDEALVREHLVDFTSFDYGFLWAKSTDGIGIPFIASSSGPGTPTQLTDSSIFKTMNKPTYAMYYYASYSRYRINMWGCSSWVCGQPGTEADKANPWTSIPSLIEKAVEIVNTHRCCRTVSGVSERIELTYTYENTNPGRFPVFVGKTTKTVTPCGVCITDSKDERPKCPPES